MQEPECHGPIEARVGRYVLRYGPTPLLKAIGAVMIAEGYLVQSETFNPSQPPPGFTVPQWLRDLLAG